MTVKRPEGEGDSRRPGRWGEFELIRKFLSGPEAESAPGPGAASAWPTGQGVVIGPGDDAAVLRPPGDRVILQTTDLLVEGIHFRRDWGTPRHLGWKSLAVNLSDIAAMGGQPLHCLLSLALPPPWTDAEVMEFRRGFLDLACRFDVALIGGDVTASPGPLLISVTVNGAADPARVLTRAGARPGDVIWISRPPGAAAAGLELLREGSPEVYPELLEAFLQPRPEVELGLACAAGGRVRALIDVSDGLAGDLGHILEASGVGAELEETALPVLPALKSAARNRNWNLREYMLRGGEEYSLLGCTPEGQWENFDRALREKLGRGVYAIGRVRREAGLVLRHADGREENIAPRAYDHFR
ncbi:MAG: thiamine-phosphate kinase [Candidatus Zixiibacteriota bacterium]|nr:MAG: thiamine-phosphate kinase [candidate division Zixibacteria bacterium]